MSKQESVGDSTSGYFIQRLHGWRRSAHLRHDVVGGDERGPPRAAELVLEVGGRPPVVRRVLLAQRPPGKPTEAGSPNLAALQLSDQSRHLLDQLQGAALIHGSA